MKKVIFALAAVVALAACSKEEAIRVDRQAIAFGDAFVENSTRADYSDGQDLTKFNVYGTVTGTAGTVNIFEGVEVTGTVGAADWTYAEQYAQYWIPGADYNFAAVVDADGVGTSTAIATKGMPTTLTSTADATTGVRKDLLYAEAHVEDAIANQGRVNFNFNHLLSKVHFTVTSNAMGGYYHTVTGISVSSFKTATFTLDNVITPGTIDAGTWAAGSETSNALNVPFAEIANVTSATGARTNADMLLVPNAATFNVTFTVDLYKGTTKLGTETITKTVETDLVKGNAYNFTIACSVGNPIKFGVTEDVSWDGDHDEDGDVDADDDVTIVE